MPNKKEKSGKEKSTNKGIEYRVGWIVVAPILVAPEVVFEEREGKCFGDGARNIAMIEFRVEDGDMSGTRSEIIRVGNKKVIEHRRGSDEGAQDKYESVFPKPFIKFLVGQEEGRKENQEHERSNAESDVGMNTDAKNEPGEEKVTPQASAESSEEEVEGKSEDKGDHDRPEADTRKINGPVGGSEHKSAQEAGYFAMKQLFAEEIHAEHPERSKEDRGEFEPRKRVP